MENYQGWANWHTWNVALWLNNVEWTYKAARRWARLANCGQEARTRYTDALRDLAMEVIPDTERIHFDCVDWAELIDSLLAE